MINKINELENEKYTWKKIKTKKMNDDILERNFIEFILKKMLDESKKSETKKDL